MNTLEGRSISHPELDEIALSNLDASGESLNEASRAELKALEDRILQSILSDARSANCDESVYVGGPGVAYMLVKAASFRHAEELFDSAMQFMTPWEGKLRRILKRDPSLACSLLCGNAGWYCVDVLRNLGRGNSAGANKSAQAYIDLACTAVSRELDSDEWLYGRAGYLHGLLLLQSVLGNSIVTNDLLVSIASVILENGKRCAERLVSACPLMWAWHRKPYLGAAHGVAGIIFMLLHIEAVVQDEHWRSLIITTIDELITMSTENNNWPAKCGDSQAYMVQFCHGAPGFVYLLCKAYVVFEEPRYLHQAIMAGDTVWQYGLLKKGAGLCHGIAGNGYTLLKLFQTTRDAKWLLRAHSFAKAMFAEGVLRQSSTPDNPLSLFEGLAGTVCFLLDLRLAPLTASFPLFEVGGLHIP